jgi:hypothetical protein
VTPPPSCGDWGSAIEQALPKRKVQKAADCDGEDDGAVDAAAADAANFKEPSNTENQNP